MVPPAQVGVLVGEDGAELGAGEQVDRTAGDDDRGPAPADALGRRAGAVEHHRRHVRTAGAGEPDEQPVPAPLGVAAPVPTRPTAQASRTAVASDSTCPAVTIPAPAGVPYAARSRTRQAPIRRPRSANSALGGG